MEVPGHFYNALSVVDVPPPRGNLEILERILPRELLKQETSKEKFIPIPREVREIYQRYRPTPLVRARELEEFLGLKKVKIYYKREDTTFTGSHKLNTALMQAYLAKKEGFERLTTETGAGQWGTALSFASNVFGLETTVYMVRISYNQKSYRKTLMRIFGAEVIPSSSERTKIGRKFLQEDPNHPGSLGIAISEAIEDALEDENAVYSLGSVLNSVLLHQTVIGQEVREQLNEREGITLVGCVGGGSNFGGLILPFLEDKIRGRDIEFVAVEPKNVASLTKGEYRYDYGDSAGLTPQLLMYTLGYTFVPPLIHVGGLRYHGMAPLISKLYHDGLIKARAYPQREVFRAGILFAKMEGIVPAPETAHAVKGSIDLALEYEELGEERTIVIGLSGHGLLDLKGYEDFLEGRIK